MRERSKILLVVLVVVASLPVARTLRLRAMEHYLATERYEDVYYLPAPHWLVAFSLGHREALADLVWMRALVYFGTELKERGEVQHVFRYGEAIVGLDPWFARAYRWVGTIGMYKLHGYTVDDLRRSVEFLERGAQRMPDDGELAWDAGASIAYELLPNLPEDDPDREALSIRASEYMTRSVALGASPAWVTLASTSLLNQLGQNERALRHLEETLPLVDDARVRTKIEQRIASLRSDAYARAVQQTLEEEEAARRRDYPYVDPDLYFFLGARPAADPKAALRALLPSARSVETEP